MEDVYQRFQELLDDYINGDSEYSEEDMSKLYFAAPAQPLGLYRLSEPDKPGDFERYIQKLRHQRTDAGRPITKQDIIDVQTMYYQWRVEKMLTGE